MANKISNNVIFALLEDLKNNLGNTSSTVFATQSNLTQEISDRSNADTNLQQQIDGIASGVSTFAFQTANRLLGSNSTKNSVLTTVSDTYINDGDISAIKINGLSTFQTNTNTNISTLLGYFNAGLLKISVLPAITNSNINDLAYSKLTGVPTSFASKLSLLTADQNYDLGSYYITSSSIVSNINQLTNKSYVDNLVSSVLPSGASANQVIVYDSTNNKPKWALLTNSNINDLSYSKLTSVPSSFASKLSLLTADQNYDLGSYYITSSSTVSNINQLTNKNYVDTLVSNVLPSGASANQVIVYDSGTNKPKWALLSNSNINDLSYSKLTSVPSSFASKLSLLTADQNYDLGSYYITSSSTISNTNQLTNKKLCRYSSCIYFTI
jgi:hypothetical protein